MSLPGSSRDPYEKNSLLHSPGATSPGPSSGRRASFGMQPPSPFSDRPNSSLSEKFSLAADPREWGSDISMNTKEPDDVLHNPDPRRDRKSDSDTSFFSSRGLANLGCLAILSMAILGLFAGFPIIQFLTRTEQSTNGGFNLGGLNASGQVPAMSGNFGLIDRDTPEDAYTAPSMQDGSPMTLVFSDEFNTDGRTFYPGDDPFWEAVDLHYWGTNNLEWYDPASLTTEDGSLAITLSKVPDPTKNHNMDYRGGMMSTWNKFCFTGGQVLAAVNLPGASNVIGLWPAIWAMGNLGRAGYGASLDGTWPYSYDSCDVGTLKNQSMDGVTPEAAFTTGAKEVKYTLSYLPGQRLSRCTCPGESHPGPIHKDGTYVGRAAPEIDMFEAQVENGVGHVSQSGQWAPFNAAYEWPIEGNLEIIDEKLTHYNTYLGGVYQQASSCVTTTNQQCYQHNSTCMSTYGFEYKPGYDDAYMAWMTDAKVAWKLKAAGMGPDDAVKIAARPVPQEPMYLIANLGLSMNFGGIDFDHLEFPAIMRIDWIRVYQDPKNINIGCDPVNFPTKAYIDEYLEAYTNPNLTTWVDDYKQEEPRNSLLDVC